MKHTMIVKLNAVTFCAYAEVSYTPTGRTLERVTCDEANPDVLNVLGRSALDLNDVLFVVAEYLTLTGKTSIGTACGHLAIDCAIVDPKAFQDDLNGRTYMVKLVDVQSNRHLIDVGAPNGLMALKYAAGSIPVPVRSSVSQPVMEA